MKRIGDESLLEEIHFVQENDDGDNFQCGTGSEAIEISQRFAI